MPPAGTITVANSLLAGGKPVIVHVASGSEIKRYSPDSVKSMTPGPELWIRLSG